MWLGGWFDAYLEAEYRVFIEQQNKAANRESWYAIKNTYPPTLLSMERIVNDLKPAARYLSPLAMVVSLGIAVYLMATPVFILTLGLLAVILALLALWLQNIAK